MAERLTQVTIVEKEPHKLLPGEAAYSTMHDAWLLGCPGEHPGDHGIANLGNHTVIYLAGLLTASPSILCGCGAHYFVTDNQIRWV